MQIPYSRPTRLSNPFKDFTEDELSRILSVKDLEMGWPELACIFQSYLPAGTYEECAYFIPLALKFIQNGNEAPSLIQDFLLWCDHNYAKLEADKLLKPILETFHEHFGKILSSFEFFRNADGILYPNNASELYSYLETMHACYESPTIMLSCEEWLKEAFILLNSYLQAAWLIALINNYTRLGFYKSEFMDEILKNESIMKTAKNLVENFVLPSDDKILFEYWDGELKYYPTR